eukprot:7770024-Prorocentrum_lima.AAC.1
MTSSLVGSEMCIRDRPSTYPGNPAAAAGPIAYMHAVTFVRIARHRPVSYTHLTLPTICSV